MRTELLRRRQRDKFSPSTPCPFVSGSKPELDSGTSEVAADTSTTRDAEAGMECGLGDAAEIEHTALRGS